MSDHRARGGADTRASRQLQGHDQLVVQELENLLHTLLALKKKKHREKSRAREEGVEKGLVGTVEIIGKCHGEGGGGRTNRCAEVVCRLPEIFKDA